MRLIVDSNQLQSDRLERFLARSSLNEAVLTDFVAMEAYKGDSLNSIFKSMKIVSKYPNQVLILKGSRRLFGVSGKPKGLQRRFVDEDQTKGFKRYVRDLRQAREGNLRIQQTILAHGKFADEHFDKMLQESAEMRQYLAVMAKVITKEERAVLRNRDAYPSALTNKIISTTIELAVHIVKNSGLVHVQPTFEQLVNTYYFRVTLACYLLGLNRAAHSDIAKIRPDKLRNDFVDMTLVAAASYFDGILSEDARVNEMYEEVTLLLSGALGAHVPFIDNGLTMHPE